MIRRCCLDSGVCNKIKPVAYSGRPLHKIGNIPDGQGGTEDLFSGYGELYSVNYSNRSDNVFSYKITGDEKNIYHCCGTDGIHVYSLSDFYTSSNLSSRWKIDSASSQGVSASVSSFGYGEPNLGGKITGYLNSVDGGDACYRYGYEPTQFSGFYDCVSVGEYLIAAKGVSGIIVYKFNSGKTSATQISSLVIPNSICKNLQVVKIGRRIVIVVGSAKYVKPVSAFSSDSFDLSSVVPLDFTDPENIQKIQDLGWGSDTGAYQYASINGYESETTDGFNSIQSMGQIKNHCVMFDLNDERWILKEAKEKEKQASSSFSDLLSESFYDGPSTSSSAEIASISCINRGSSLDTDGNAVTDILANYGFAIAGSSAPIGGSRGRKLLVTKKSVLNNAEEAVDVFEMASQSEWTGSGSQPVLSFLDRAGASFFSRYFDGLQGSQSSSAGGMAVEKDGVGAVLYELTDLEYDYYTSWGSTYTYDFYSGYKIDLMSIFLSKSHAMLSLFEAGLLIACRDTSTGSTILDWEHFDSFSSNLTAGQEQQFIASLNEGSPSTLNIIDSWTDGKTVFCVDSLQYSVASGPRSLGLYFYPSSVSGAGSPETGDERRSYLYRTDSTNSNVAAGGGVVAFSLV